MTSPKDKEWVREFLHSENSKGVSLAKLIERYGLEWEVTTSYKKFRKEGATLSQSIWYAVEEWDL